MRVFFATSAWIVFFLLIAAAPLRQVPPLEGPLLSANMCGGGMPGDTHFTFAATGDTFPHVNIQAVGETHGYDYLFDHIRPFLQAADIAYTNFDGAMLAGSAYTGYPTFNYNPQLATALKNAGIGVVSTANNHILDRGPAGIDATLAVLDEAGIAHHGAVSSAASTQPRPPYQPIVLERGGVRITIGFLSFTWGTNGIPDPHNQVNLLWQSNSYGSQGGIRQSVLDAIAQARRETDMVIVAAHWGYEYHSLPDHSQVEGARRMAEAGADVILGAQPHTLQPVDIIDTGGRKTLVIYSLANFIASQGAFQHVFFSNTTVVFYVGLIRRADGSVHVSGYRYLPMTMTDYDTRPAPIATHGADHLHQHVRRHMRDPHGMFQVPADPAALGGRVEVCPTYTFAEAPGGQVSGDFAQYFATLGSGTTPRPLSEAVAVFGYPLGPPVQELTGDCQRTTSVLYTERQRLEWHPENDWPRRVIGTQLGTATYRQRYGVDEVQRRLDLEGGAFASEPFRAFYHANGGLAVLGYPISGAHIETDPTTGQQYRVQYFERARLELPLAADPASSGQVRLGLLGREYAGIEAACGSVPDVAAAPDAAAGEQEPPPLPTAPAVVVESVPAQTGGHAWLWYLALLSGVLLLASVAYAGWLRAQRRVRRQAPVQRPPAAANNDEALLRRLLRAEDTDLLRRLLDLDE
jgi:poly-gamma-glutamate capsule biosynthesis protein CapA/YwtB (metallophosphatase superfamily)